MFSNFRRNQRVGVALLIFVAIMAFIVAPILQQYLESQQRAASGADETLVSYSGGEITRDSLDRFQFVHHRTVAFLLELAQRVQEKGGQPRVPGFIMDPRSGQIRPGISAAVTPEGSVETILHSRRAEQMGLTLDDDAVTQWLALYTDSKISGAELQQLLSEVSQGQIGRSQLYSHLRMHLQANLLNRIARTGIEAGQSQLATPDQLWHEFQKLNQNATVAAYPVLVDRFLDEVDEPTEAEIEELYEEYKDEFPSPDSPEPGFRRRYAANVEYLAARMSDFIEREAEQIDEETLRAEYEQRAAAGAFDVDANQFPLETQPAVEEQTEAGGEPATGEATRPTVETEAEGDAEAAETEGTATEPAEQPAAQEPEAEARAQQPPAEQQQPADDAEAEAQEEPAAEAEAVEETTTDEPAGDTDADQSALPTRPVQLVNFLQQEADADDQTAAEATDAAADGPQTAAEPATDADQPEQADAEPQEDAPAESEQAPAELRDADTEPAEVTPDTQDTDTQDTDAPAGAEPTADTAAPAEGVQPEEPAEPEQRTLSFEEVRDQLARELARPLAAAKMQSALQEAQSTMLSYFVERDQYENLRGENPELEMPEKPDLQELAEELGLDYGVTGMQDALSISDQEIAGTVGGEGRGQQFASLVYNDENPLFAPLRTTDRFSADYVFWKTDQQPAYVPSLEEAREEVVAALKLQAARELAQERAQQLAENARESEEPLVEVVPEENRQLVLESVGPFSWMMSFGQFSQPIVTNVPDLDRVGERFMQEVFDAEPGDVVTAPNEPETVYYVVKVKNISPSDEELREQFLQPAQRQMAAPLVLNKAIDIYTSWYRSVEDQLNVERAEELE